LKKQAAISPPRSSRSSILKRVPAPLALFHDFMSLLFVMRALMVQRFWYGLSESMGW